MLLVEQGVLCVLPMLWLVLLLSEAGGFGETGCILASGPGICSKAEKERTWGGGEERQDYNLV